MENAKKLSDEFFNRGQSWCYEAIWQYKEFKLKIDIRRNAFDGQSHLKCSIFDRQELQWNFLVSIPISKAHCLPTSYVWNKEKAIQQGLPLFKKDARALIAKAKLVLD